MIKDMNMGEIRVLFGSIEMLGTGGSDPSFGRIVAASDLEQRDGRAIRKGNDIAKQFADNKVDVNIRCREIVGCL